MPDIVDHLTQIIRPPRQVSIPPPLSIGLGALACIGLLYKSNSYLSRRALNSPAGKDTWDWDKEIVVVTGDGWHRLSEQWMLAISHYICNFTVRTCI